MDIEQLTESEWGQVLKGTREGVFVLDRGGRVLLFNGACTCITGYTSEELLDGQGKSLVRSLMPHPDSLTGGTPYLSRRLHVLRKDGSAVSLNATYVLLRDLRGGVQAVLGVIREVSAKGERAGDDVDAEPITLNLTDAVERDRKSLDEILEDVERQAIIATLRCTGGHRTKAAKQMRISRSRLYRRLGSLDIL